MFFKRNGDLRRVSLPNNKMSLHKHENIIFDLSDDECIREEDDEEDDGDDDDEGENEDEEGGDNVQEEDEDEDFDEMMLEQQANHPSNNTPFPNWDGIFNRRFKKTQGKDYVSDEDTPTLPDEDDPSMREMVRRSFREDYRRGGGGDGGATLSAARHSTSSIPNRR
ncbi:hypothetical protein AALP_AA7G134200 [Arabis alpina]|uniref:Uncharacterized protein n=1 Tax=Arabis alpina TaxID=50452 RepID=A0A087GHT4_ARAAL|nr:hypothetical protein AALP_AA7G134200 [Arabis alpina]